MAGSYSSAYSSAYDSGGAGPTFKGWLWWYAAKVLELSVFKNAAGQKVTLFAFDVTTGAPKTGDAANLTFYVSKDDGAVTALGDTTATEDDATNAKGMYTFDLTQAETNADKLKFTGKSSTANVVVVPAVVYTTPPNFGALGIGSNGHVTNVDTLTTYTGNTPQTGDNFARIGANGAGLSAVPDETGVTTLLARLTSGRAGYLDNLSAGAVATAAQVSSLQVNTRANLNVPVEIETPDAGTQVWKVRLHLFDSDGNMEAPDSTPTVTLTNAAGTDRGARLSAASNPSTGVYTWDYTATAGDAEEQLVWVFTVVEGGLTRTYPATSYVVEETAYRFSSSDRSLLSGISTRALLALPAFAPAAAGGLITRGTGAGQLQPRAGFVLVDTDQDVSGFYAADSAGAALQNAARNLTAAVPSATQVAAAVWANAARTLTALPAIPNNWITTAGIADDAITDAKIAVPAETAGRPSRILAMLRRLFEGRHNKRTRDRTTGLLTVRNAADNANLETSTQSTTGTTDTQTAGA